MAREVLTVGEVARAAGLSAKAVRLYEAKGLVPPAQRTDAGYRTYAADDIAVLQLIRQAKTLGLTLTEIRDILEIRRDGTPPCRHVLALLDRHLAEIDRTITDLRQLRRALADTRARAAAAPAGDNHTVCKIIEHV
jgi:MerR family copper efflux transcriptional regulator